MFELLPINEVGSSSSAESLPGLDRLDPLLAVDDAAIRHATVADLCR
jgi:hypothetical protein